MVSPMWVESCKHIIQTRFSLCQDFSCFIFLAVDNGGMTVDQIIKYFGGKSQAAKALDCHLQTLRDWRKNGIPPKTQAWIQLETGGALKASKK